MQSKRYIVSINDNLLYLGRRVVHRRDREAVLLQHKKDREQEPCSQQ